MASLQQIISWFQTGLFPTSDQFRQTWLSYWHKSEKIPQSQIFGLQETIESATRGLIYQNPVTNVADLYTTYPNAKVGWASMVTSEGYIYSYNGTAWANTGLKEFPEDVVTQDQFDQVPRIVGYEIAMISGGGYLTASGAVAAQSQYDVSDYIPVVSGDKLIYTGTTGTSTYGIIGYDAGMSYKVQMMGSSTTYVNHEFLVPDGVYFVRISGRNMTFPTTPAHTVSCQLFGNPVEREKSIIKQLIISISFTNGIDLYADGTTHGNGVYATSDFVPVHEGDIIIYTGEGSSPRVAWLFYNANKAVIAGSEVYGHFDSYNLVIPSGVSFVRFSGRITNLSYGKPVSASTVGKLSDYATNQSLQNVSQDVKNLDNLVNEGLSTNLLPEDSRFDKNTPITATTAGVWIVGSTVASFSQGEENSVKITPLETNSVVVNNTTVLVNQGGVEFYVKFTAKALTTPKNLAIALGSSTSGEPNQTYVSLYNDWHEYTVKLTMGDGLGYNNRVAFILTTSNYMTVEIKDVSIIYAESLPIRVSLLETEVNNVLYSGDYYKNVDIDIPGYPLPDGTLAAGTTFSRTGFLPVKTNDIIQYTGCSGSSSLAIAGYSSADQTTFVTALLASSIIASQVKVIIPSGINYVIISGKNVNYIPYPAYLPASLVPTSIKDDISSVGMHNRNLIGKRASFMGDSISAGSNAREWTVMDIDVGNSLDGYPTYYDVGKTIGDVTVTSDMIGTLVTFTNIKQEDIGKFIGETSSNATVLGKWWQVLCSLTGMEALQNVSMSSISMSSHEDKGTLKGFYAWHPSQIKKCSTRDDHGNAIIPDVVVIYRGTNDFSHSPYSRLTDLSSASTAYPDTDVLSDGNYGFKEAYCLTIKKLRESYPHVKIYCCTLNLFKRVVYNQYPTRNGYNTLPEYNDTIREIANMMGCGLIEFDKDGINWENLTDFAPDQTHTNAAGQLMQGEKAAIDMISSFN